MKSVLFLATLLVSASAGSALAQSPSEGAEQSSLFAVMFTPGPGWDSTLAPNAQRHFDLHSANLARLRRDSTIVAGGRFGRWGLILLAAPDEAAARAMLEPDSSIAAGTFRADVYPWSTIYEGFVPRRRTATQPAAPIDTEPADSTPAELRMLHPRTE